MTSPLHMDAPPPYSATFADKHDKHHEARKGFSEDVEGLLTGENLEKNAGVAFANVTIRMKFLRKVFGILAAQLLLTSIIGAAFIYTPGLKGVVQQWSWMVLVGFVLSIILLVAMHVKRHDFPINYILLTLWTICQSYTVGVVASFCDKDAVVLAFVLTAGVVMALFIYAMQTRRDFSSWGAGLFSVVWILILGGFIQMFIMSPTFDFVLALVGAVVFSLFIIYDVQQITYHISPEEYISATITLYLDILNLFLQILRLVEHFRRQ